MMMHLAGDLRIMHEDVFADESLKGLGTAKTGTALRTGEGGQNGALCIKVVASKAAAIAADKTLTVEIMSGAAKDSLEAIDKTTVSGAKAFAKGELVYDYVLPPSAKEWTSVRLTCDDAAATGSVDVYLQYLAR